MCCLAGIFGLCQVGHSLVLCYFLFFFFFDFAVLYEKYYINKMYLPIYVTWQITWSAGTSFLVYELLTTN